MFYPKLKERPLNFRINRGVGHPLAKGLVLAMLGRLPGTGQAHDSSVYGYDGTLIGMDSRSDWVWVPKLGRWALDFDGVDDRVRIPIPVAIATPLTMATWFNDIGYASSDRALLDIRRTSGPTYCFSLYVTAGAVNCHSYGPDGIVFAKKGTYSANTWNHAVAMHRNPSSRFAYLNGVAGNEYTTTVTPSGFDHTQIGMVFDTLIPFLGQIADAMIWNRVLSQSEISALADPDNVDLRIGGVPLILPPRRVWWPVAHIPGTKKTPWHLMIQGAV